MSVTRQNGRYLVRQQVHGRDIRAHAPSKKLADQIDATLTAQRLGTRFGLPQDKPRVVFGDWFDQWLDLFATGQASRRRPKPQTVARARELKARLSPLLPLFVDEVDRERVESVCSRIAGENKLDRAFKVCALVRRVVGAAQERGYLVDQSVLQARVAKPKPRQQKALSWAEVELLAGEMPDHIHRGVLFLALTGLRVSEFCALTDADVFLGGGSDADGRENSRADRAGGGSGGEDSRGGLHLLARREGSLGVGSGGSRRTDVASYILVRQSKTDAGQRQVFLCREAARLVREQMLARPNAGSGQSPPPGSPGQSARPGGVAPTSHSRLLFPNERGNPYNKDSFRQTLQRAAKRAGIEGVHPHTLRSTHMTFLAQSGVDVMIAKELMGWADATFASMLPIYRKVAGSEVSVEVLRLDVFLAGDERQEVEA